MEVRKERDCEYHKNEYHGRGKAARYEIPSEHGPGKFEGHVRCPEMGALWTRQFLDVLHESRAMSHQAASTEGERQAGDANSDLTHREGTHQADRDGSQARGADDGDAQCNGTYADPNFGPVGVSAAGNLIDFCG